MAIFSVFYPNYLRPCCGGTVGMLNIFISIKAKLNCLIKNQDKSGVEEVNTLFCIMLWNLIFEKCTFFLFNKNTERNVLPLDCIRIYVSINSDLIQHL